MTLDRQLEDARQALEALTADEAELSRLALQQAAEIAALKAAGSRDFAHLANLEGKRAALTSMLEEQRAHVAQARALLEKREGAHRLEAQLVRAGDLAEKIRGAQASLDGALLAFVERNLPEVQRLLSLQDTWDALQAEWATLARELGDPGSLRATEQHDALMSTLRARGVDVQALRATRHPRPGSLFEQFVPWPVPQTVQPQDGFDLRLKGILQEAVIQAIEAKSQVEASAHYIPGVGGRYDTGLFSHLPKQPKGKGWADVLNPER